MAHILVIDDDQDILRLIEFALQRAGHSVTIAADGEKGLAQIETRRPDLIVADVMMPHMTGYDFCRQVRAKPTAADIPIIIFSARFQPVDRQTALQAGATDYIAKTTSPNALVQRIEELLPESTPNVSTVSIGFMSFKGGAGVTSLAVNSAVALALAKKSQVAMVDLAPLGGHAALMLGLRPSKSISEALAIDHRLSLTALKPYFIEHNSGVHLLASALNYDRRLSAHTNHLEQLVTVLKPNYPFTIFDLAQFIFQADSTTLLPQLDKLVLVITPEMASLQSTALLLQTLTRLGVAEQKIVLVVNQLFAQHALPLEAIQKVLKRVIAANIPFEPELVKAVNSGQPLLLSSPKSAGAVAIARLANRLLS
jgi:pilus assembly protein CpaE